ncbi:fibronectin type III domain-containing protein 5-like [Belonocnema kinseyi]|uniref:fibronectin type III domain-containing protein 5-like n=1 Tax=Belonocnema kinseyi TaxID=2817044 RepID=UPI00143D4B80|nr:fibronectin type III domain-containing protein 5-like [Belonocnema kinseyi]
MVLWATILFLQGAGLVGSMTGIKGVPENITVMFLNPTSVRVSWSTSQVEKVEKYDVTYKPTDARFLHLSLNSTAKEVTQDYRVVAVVAGNSEAVTLSGLRADTQYQLVVTAVRGGKRYKSRPIVFRTLEPPKTSPQQDAASTGSSPPPTAQHPQTYLQIRGVEVGIVVLVLIVWAGAIALFFNRWGKIRMLLPYQPDYKQEQLKVPGTGVCSSTTAAYTHHSSQHNCSQGMTTLWDMVQQCGGGGCCVFERCFQYPRRAREPRECGCQFALLHRADIA